MLAGFLADLNRPGMLAEIDTELLAQLDSAVQQQLLTNRLDSMNPSLVRRCP